MASKPTLFWTLKRHAWSGGFELMRVTTAKPRRYYGTDRDGENTQAPVASCTGRYDTQERAEEVIQRMASSRRAHSDNVAVLSAARNMAERLEREAIEAVAEGRQPPAPPDPLDLVRRALSRGVEACRRIG